MNFFQSTHAHTLFTRAFGNRVIEVTSPDGHHFLLAQVSGGRGLSRYLTTKVVVWHGPAGDPDAEQFEALLEGLRRRLPWYTLFVQFRMAEERPGLEGVFVDSGYHHADRLNLLTPVADLELTWKGLSASRRREIRRSEAGGLTTAKQPTPEQVRGFYQLLRRLYRHKVRKPLPDEAFFQEFNRLVSEGVIPGVFIVCMLNQRVVGGIVCPVTPGDTMYELYICGDDQALNGLRVYPSVMATWAAMEEANRMGCHTFDFMGMGVPERPYGVREFKARFGGKWINPGRWNRVYNPLLYYLAEVLYNVYHWLKR